MVALLMIFALSVVMVLVRQPVAAVTALIPAAALGVQQIVRVRTGAEASPCAAGAAPTRINGQDGE
ncbi:hypothetical protein [Streptomyces sp. NPDC006879]|uniref:hypothetical protein n=1 Tax=Streptomyces sp. NPDC006879 TaxID=3364767 RepID=UPI0036C3F1AA